MKGAVPVNTAEKATWQPATSGVMAASATGVHSATTSISTGTSTSGVTGSLLLIPATFMGATLPVLSRFFVRSLEQTGRPVGLLYSVNTFGAVLGGSAAGFLLIPNLGVTATIWTASLLNALVAVMDIRLRDVLREDLSGTYGVSVSAQTQQKPVPSYNVSIRFGTAPARLDTLAAEVFRQIDSLKVQGPAPDVVTRVQEQERRERETARRTNGYWLAQLLRGAQIGDRPGAFLAADALTEQLTPARIQDAARRWLNPANYVRVSLFPEK